MVQVKIMVQVLKQSPSRHLHSPCHPCPPCPPSPSSSSSPPSSSPPSSSAGFCRLTWLGCLPLHAGEKPGSHHAWVQGAYDRLSGADWFKLWSALSWRFIECRCDVISVKFWVNPWRDHAWVQGTYDLLSGHDWLWLWYWYWYWLSGDCECRCWWSFPFWTCIVLYVCCFVYCSPVVSHHIPLLAVASLERVAGSNEGEAM